MTKKVFVPVRAAGILLSEIFHYALLFIAAIIIIWAAIYEITQVLQHNHPSLKDILMLFIFIELGAMVGIYFKTNRLSVRFLIYVGITALTRILVIDVKEMSISEILTFTGAIVMLTVAVFVLRACDGWFGHDGDESD